MLEAELSKAVIKTAQQLGWKVAHFAPAPIRKGRIITPVKADGAGFPDLVLTNGSRIIFAELKQDKNYPKPHQREWLGLLSDSGAEVYVWKPKNWHDGSIISLLKQRDMSHSSEGVNDA